MAGGEEGVPPFRLHPAFRPWWRGTSQQGDPTAHRLGQFVGQFRYRNFPYRGIADGLIPRLRRVHGVRRQAGIEIEMSQERLGGSRSAVETYVAVVLESAQRVLRSRP